MFGNVDLNPHRFLCYIFGQPKLTKRDRPIFPLFVLELFGLSKFEFPSRHLLRGVPYILFKLSLLAALRLSKTLLFRSAFSVYVQAVIFQRSYINPNRRQLTEQLFPCVALLVA